MIYEYLMYRLQNEEFRMAYIVMWAFAFLLMVVTMLICKEMILIVPAFVMLSYLLEEIFLFKIYNKFNKN